MSGLLALTNPRDISTGQAAYVGPSGSLLDIVSQSYRSSRLNFNANSSTLSSQEVYAERQRLYEELTGESINAIWSGKIDGIRGQGSRASNLKRKLIDEKISNLKFEDPETFGDLLTSQEVEAEARRRATESLRQYEETFEYTPGVSKHIAGFAGAVGASFTDPVQLALGGVTLGASVAVPGIGYGASILRQAAIDAGQSALVEAAIQPEIAEWQKQLGRDYGLGDALVSVAAAGATGGLLSLPIGAASRLTRNLDTSRLFEQLAQSEGIADSLRIAYSEIAEAMRVRESAPSPDLPRHSDNVSTVNKAASEGRPIRTSEIRARITDDIDGLPSEAFDFLDPDKKYLVTNTFTADGVEPIVRTAELKIRDMTVDQLKSLISKTLLPKIARELREDIDAHRRNSPNAESVNQGIRTAQGQIKTHQKQFSDAKRAAIKRRDGLIAEADDRAKAYRNNAKGSTEKKDKKAKELRTTLRAQAEAGYKTAIRNAERAFAEQKIVLDQKIRKLESFFDQESYNNERLIALKDVEQGIVPQGGDYTSRSIRGTFERILDASLAVRKPVFQSADKPEILQRLSDMGVINRPLEPVEAIQTRLSQMDSELDELVQVSRSELDDVDKNTILFDDEGNQTTLGRMLDYTDDEAELTAIRTCATGIK